MERGPANPTHHHHSSASMSLLNYSNFEVYLFIIPNVPIGRIICISLYPDVPIGRNTKSHEEIPFVVSRVISTPVNIILSCYSPPREVAQSVLVGLTC